MGTLHVHVAPQDSFDFGSFEDYCPSVPCSVPYCPYHRANTIPVPCCPPKVPCKLFDDPSSPGICSVWGFS